MLTKSVFELRNFKKKKSYLWQIKSSLFCNQCLNNWQCMTTSLVMISNHYCRWCCNILVSFWSRLGSVWTDRGYNQIGLTGHRRHLWRQLCITATAGGQNMGPYEIMNTHTHTGLTYKRISSDSQINWLSESILGRFRCPVELYTISSRWQMWLSW